MDTMQEHRLLSILSDDPSMILLIKNKNDKFVSQNNRYNFKNNIRFEHHPISFLFIIFLLQN